MVQVTLLSFDKTVGWRVVAHSHTDKDRKIAVVKFGHIKLLRLNKKLSTPGLFANPRKLIGI